MLMRFDPFRELDRLTNEAFGATLRPPAMPMDAYREDDRFVVLFDLPGVDPESIDLTVEQNMLTVSADRTWQPTDGQDVVASERPHGHVTRQLYLGEGLDADAATAHHENGVLTVTIPVSAHSQPRKVAIGGSGQSAKAIETGSAQA